MHLTHDGIHKHSWQFKKHFRANAYGWRGSSLACKRLKEAISEIKAVKRSDPVLAGDGVVSLCERIWPAFQGIDTSTGALGTATWNAMEELLPILIEAPADLTTRRKWTERLLEAVQDDGVEYLMQVQDNWGKICGFPELASEWADSLLHLIQMAWSDREAFAICPSSVCLSSLLEAERYDEIRELLALRRRPFWPDCRYWADALQRQGKVDDAIAYCESLLESNSNYDSSITEYCERLLLNSGREDEAYARYGLNVRQGITYFNQFRVIKKKYLRRDPRQILLDLIETSPDKGQWFAAARQMGYLDIALECARDGTPNPATLSRAARDTISVNPHFAAEVSHRALELYVQGYGYEVTTAEIREVFQMMVRAADIAGNLPQMIESLCKAVQNPDIGYSKMVSRLIDGLMR